MLPSYAFVSFYVHLVRELCGKCRRSGRWVIWQCILLLVKNTELSPLTLLLFTDVKYILRILWSHMSTWVSSGCTLLRCTEQEHIWRFWPYLDWISTSAASAGISRPQERKYKQEHILKNVKRNTFKKVRHGTKTTRKIHDTQDKPKPKSINHDTTLFGSSKLWWRVVMK